MVNFRFTCTPKFKTFVFFSVNEPHICYLRMILFSGFEFLLAFSCEYIFVGIMDVLSFILFRMTEIYFFKKLVFTFLRVCIYLSGKWE
jgi:hypothetical protein